MLAGDDNEWYDEDLQFFLIFDNSTKLDVETYRDPEPVETIRYYRTNTMWYISELNFSSCETKELRINYRVKAQLEDMLSGSSFFPEFSDRAYRRSRHR